MITVRSINPTFRLLGDFGNCALQGATFQTKDGSLVIICESARAVVITEGVPRTTTVGEIRHFLVQKVDLEISIS